MPNDRNPILNTDSYKLGHFLQYPNGTRAISAYVTTRGNSFRPDVMFFGLQMFLKEYLSRAITRSDIDEAEEIATLHGQPFDRAGWTHIVDTHGGYLPLKIEALQEGFAVRRDVPVAQVVNTDPNVPWLSSYIETALLRAIWYPSTVATMAWRIKQALWPFLERTSDRAEELIETSISDFGSRGTTSLEQTGLGGAAHLLHFTSSDSLAGVLHARRYYGALMAGRSVPASEHTTVTAWGQEREVDAYSNMIDRFARFGAYSIVADSFDLHNAVSDTLGKKLQTKIRAANATLVVRSDSGDPIDTPVQVVAQLAYAFGTHLNGKGFKVLDDNVRVIQSDGVSLQDIQMILGRLEGMGFSSENISFGMGSSLLQKVSRDTLSFTMRASALQDESGAWRDIGRRPGNPQEKLPALGRQAVVLEEGDVFAVPLGELGPRQNLLQPVWENGKPLRELGFDEIRKLAATAGAQWR